MTRVGILERAISTNVLMFISIGHRVGYMIAVCPAIPQLPRAFLKAVQSA